LPRDKELLRNLLLLLQGAPEGFSIHRISISSSGEEITEDHHYDLLMDEGLVTNKGEHTLRLTSLGHDAAEMLSKSETWEMIKAAAPKEAYEIAKANGS
jgi:hypothetical protein